MRAGRFVAADGEVREDAAGEDDGVAEQQLPERRVVAGDHAPDAEQADGDAEADRRQEVKKLNRLIRWSVRSVT